VNLRELAHALYDTIRQGEIGIPVALRVSAQFGDRSIDVVQGAILVTQLAETAFSESLPARLHARSTSDRRQLTVLASYRLGQSCFVTTTAIDGAGSTLDLLLIGNHGIVRLEGRELFDPEGGDSSLSDYGQVWKSAIEQSLSDGRAVEIATVI
jgi:hypothetical protein